MKKVSCFIVLFLSCTGLSTQAQVENFYPARTADSLDRKLRERIEDTTKADVLNALSGYWREKDPRKAYLYANEALSLSQRTGNKFSMATAYFNAGNALATIRKLDSAEQKYLSALELLKSIKEDKSIRLQALVWNKYGFIYQWRRDSRQGLDILLNRAVPLLERVKDSANLGGTYGMAGAMFFNLNEPDKALFYLQKAIKDYKSYLRPNFLAELYLFSARAIMLKKTKDLKLVGSYLELASALLQKDPPPAIWGTYLSMKGHYYLNKQIYPKALAFFDRGLRWEQEKKINTETFSLLYGKSEACFRMNKLSLAKQVIYEAYNFSKGRDFVLDPLLALDKIVALEAATGNYKMAYQRLLEYRALSDSIKYEQYPGGI